MKKIMTATATRTAPDAHYTTYRDPPATLNNVEFAHYLMTTNPQMAMMMVAAMVEMQAAQPSEDPNKLVEVSVFDDDGTPLYNLTETGEAVYADTLTE